MNDKIHQHQLVYLVNVILGHNNQEIKQHQLVYLVNVILGHNNQEIKQHPWKRFNQTYFQPSMYR